MIHSRVYTEPDDKALASLSGGEYKVLRYLVNRADPRGICYPREDTIAAAIRRNVRNVRNALESLAANNWIRFVRRNQRDPITRQQLSNAYILNPDYIALAADAESEARAIWASLREESENISAGLYGPPNHQPPPITKAIKPTSVNSHQRTSTSNQPAGKAARTGADYANQHGRPKSEGQGQKGARSRDANQHAADTNQRNAPQTEQGSAPPPKFSNPKNVRAALDEWHEPLAIRIRGIGIPLPMARGFIAEYGYDRCHAALLAVGAAVLNASAENPAGLFRFRLERNLADEEAARAAQDYTHYRQPDVDDPGY